MEIKCSKESVFTKIFVGQAEMHKDVKYIKKALDGNGEEGIIKKVNENTDHRKSQESKAGLVRFVFGSGWGIAVLMIILTIINIVK